MIPIYLLLAAAACFACAALLYSPLIPHTRDNRRDDTTNSLGDAGPLDGRG